MQMKLISLTIILLAFVNLAITARDKSPPLWAQWFSQSMVVNFQDLSTTAKFWYDSTQNAQRFDFQNGNSKSGCGSIHPGNTPCTYLFVDDWLYFVYPQRSLCCKLVQQPIISRNWLQNYTFLGQKQIEDQTFDVWNLFVDEDYNQFYYVDQSQKAIPRRQYQGNRIYLDYWMNSYSQNLIPSSIFRVPSYCTKYCGQNLHSEDQLQTLIKNVRKFTSNFNQPSYRQQQIRKIL